MNMAAVPPGGRPDVQRPVVLLVEDNVLVGMAAAEMLESLGYAVHRTTSGAKALQQLAAHPDIAVLVADIGLPDMSGHVLAAQAREARPGLRVLFITGYDRAGPQRTAADAITCYLEKPYHPVALQQALQRLTAVV